MAELKQIYRCVVCHNVVEVVRPGAGELICCGKPMEAMLEKTTDEGKEKHVPVIEETKGGVRVLVGSVPHPMEEAHHIEWIEIVADGRVCRQHLLVADRPKAEFCVEAKQILARAFCNIHGLWKSV